MNRRVAVGRITIVLLALVALAGLPSCRLRPPATAESLPSRLSDEAFWQLVTDFSEPNGFFRSDNFLSNEREYQWVIPTLVSSVAPGGVYLGVGPEQNFTYIAALRPKLAFIVDIRRGNLHAHLLYKAFFEMSADRAEFLSRLFARTRPANLSPVGKSVDVQTLLASYRREAPSIDLFNQYLNEAKDWLVRRHGFNLSDEDLAGIEYVYRAFLEGGPELNYSFPNGGFGRNGNFPTYAELMTETDGRGEHRSYLASDAQFRLLSDLQKSNAIVPLVGNFSGPKALRAVGSYLRRHGATVSAFYTSNVEMYLFQQDDDWKKFYGNVAALPLGDGSTFIRSVSNRGFRFQFRGGGAGRASTRLSSMADLVRDYDAGRIDGYYDVIAMSH
jgi:hypothetical protein